jgi:GNAT superfamily N-acetyltransferase
MNSVIISTIDTSNKTALKRFVSLERKLLKNYPKYISDIDDDVIKLFNGKSQMFKEMEFALFVVSKEGVDVGRCAAIINKKFQAEKQPGSGFIGFFAAAKDCGGEVKELFSHAEDWLKEKGVTKIIAPSNGGAPQSMGFLAAGFDDDPMFPFPWHPPYFSAYIESLGYKPAHPLWYYEINFSNKKYQDAKQRHANNQAAVIRTILKKNWDKDIELLVDLLNKTFVNEWEFTSLDYAGAKEFFGPMKNILDPNQIQFAEVNGKPVGFCLALPDLTPLFRTFNGSVGLFDIPKLLFKTKKFQRAGILGIGVLDEYRGKGLSKALALSVYGYHERLGLKSSLYYPVNESNKESRGFAESIGGEGKMTYMVYDKILD